MKERGRKNAPTYVRTSSLNSSDTSKTTMLAHQKHVELPVFGRVHSAYVFHGLRGPDRTGIGSQPLPTQFATVLKQRLLK